MSRGWTGARGDYHPTDVDDLLEWLDEPMDAPVPAPDEQGDDKLYEDARESLRQAEAGERPTPREELRMKPVEQQGEPVCARCGHPEFASDGSAVHISERDLDGGDDSDDWCIGCANEKRPIWGHPFEPAPPPSEEAEAREVLWNAYDDAIVEFTQARLYGPAHWNQDSGPVQDARKAVEAAIRRPIEEERDRLRALYDEACAAMDVLALHSAPRARAEAAEAQVQELRAALEEALADIKDGWKDSAATVIRRALAAH